MPAAVPLWIGRVVKLVPAPLRSLLDAWSYRVAQRHARQRQAAWLRRRSAVPGPR